MTYRVGIDARIMSTARALRITPLPTRYPPGSGPVSSPAHWVGNPPTKFTNPWPSFVQDHGWLDMLQTRFGSDRNFVPVPESRDDLVKVRIPDWGRGQDGWSSGLKATWLGHASVLVELASPVDEVTSSEGGGQAPKFEEGQRRGLRILFDAVFSDRTSPVTWAGPKRYSPTPCSVDELPEVDIIAISHDHYDHMDLATIKDICRRQHASGKRIHFFAGLGNAKHLLAADAGILPSEITECDWWQSHSITLSGTGNTELTCTPSQHTSGRTIWDKAQTLWCGWAVIDKISGKKVYFAGDTAYKAADAPSACPAFREAGELFGGFDMAWIPIGLYSPQRFMAAVHVCPEDSLQIHNDLKSRKSFGMHYGTFRGGISQQYEDVREPPKRWREAAEKAGKWGGECDLCDIGETVIV